MVFDAFSAFSVFTVDELLGVVLLTMDGRLVRNGKVASRSVIVTWTHMGA